MHMLFNNNFVFGLLLGLIILNCINITHGSNTTIYLSPHFASIEHAAAHFKRHKPVILWDLHEVVFNFSKNRFLFYQRPERLNIWDLSREILTALFSSTTYRHMYGHAKRGNRVTEAYLNTFYSKPTLYRAFLRLANDTHQPNFDVLAIIEELYNQDIQHFIFSNIGPTLLADFRKQHPDIFKFFSNPNNAINSIKPEHDHWLYKPQPAAYQSAITFVDHATQGKPEHMIFIDDKLKNIQGAQKAGITGILCMNATQLRHDLIELGLLD